MKNIKSEYAQARKSLLSLIRRNQRFGLNKEMFKLNKPKKITEASIRRLKREAERAKAKIHEIKVETGYYTTQRLKRKAEWDIKKKEEALNKRRMLQKQAREKARKEKTPFKSKKLQRPALLSRKQKAPNLSDMVYDGLLREISEAKMMRDTKGRGNNKLVEAINKSADKAMNEFLTRFNEFKNKYKLTDEEAKKAISKNLMKNYYSHYEQLERYLYDFESNDNGQMIHIDEERNTRLIKILNITFNLDLDEDYADYSVSEYDEIFDGDEVDEY